MGLLSSLFSNILLMLNDAAAPRRAALNVLSTRATLTDNATLGVTELDLRPIETGGGAIVIFQPGGEPGANIVTTESDVQAALDRAFEFGLGGGTFIIDGTYAPFITLAGGGWNLWNFFEVRLTSVSSITVSNMPDGSAIFLNPRGSIRGDVMTEISNTSSVNGVYLAQFDVATPVLGTTFKFENVTWITTSSARRPMARVRRGGACVLDFENCSFGSVLTAAQSGSLLWIQDQNVTLLDVYWHGTIAGMWDTTQTRLFYTTLTTVGPVKRVTYKPGRATAAAFTWPGGMEWASTAPTIYNLNS